MDTINIHTYIQHVGVMINDKSNDKSEVLILYKSMMLTLERLLFMLLFKAKAEDGQSADDIVKGICILHNIIRDIRTFPRQSVISHTYRILMLHKNIDKILATLS